MPDSTPGGFCNTLEGMILFLQVGAGPISGTAVAPRLGGGVAIVTSIPFRRKWPRLQLFAEVTTSVFKVLERAGVKILVGASGTVADAVAQFKRNQLTPVDAPNVEGHWV